MNNEITSKVIGQLEPVKDWPGEWRKDDVKIPLFDNLALPITMVIKPEPVITFMDEADQALANFLALTTDDRNAISDLAYENCAESLDVSDFDGADELREQIIDNPDKNEIWKFVHPTEIYVRRRGYKENSVYVMVACDCDWEEEHGLQLVFKQGKKLTRISDQDGHLTDADADGKPDEEDELLSKFGM